MPETKQETPEQKQARLEAARAEKRAKQLAKVGEGVVKAIQQTKIAVAGLDERLDSKAVELSEVALSALRDVFDEVSNVNANGENADQTPTTPPSEAPKE